jgi:hypothetical protein
MIKMIKMVCQYKRTVNPFRFKNHYKMLKMQIFSTDFPTEWPQIKQFLLIYCILDVFRQKILN